MTTELCRRPMVPLAAITVCLAAFCGSCQARSQIWEGQVRQEGDLPCFTVENSKETQRMAPVLAFISVAEIDESGAEERMVWMVSVTGHVGTALSPRECIQYGASIPGTTVNTPASVLYAGKRYEVFINSDIGKAGHRQNRRYHAHFCLTNTASRTQVHQVRWDERASQRHWDVCGIQNGP